MRKISTPKAKSEESLQKSIKILSRTIESMNATILKIEIDEKNNMAHIFYEFKNYPLKG